MYMLTTGTGTNYAYPDTCETMVGSAESPITYTNTSYSSVATPYISTVTVECMPVVTLCSYDSISTGDESGTYGGTASFTFCGETMYSTGSTLTTVSCVTPAHYCSTTGQNCLGVLSNTTGSTLSPSQYIVYAT